MTDSEDGGDEVATIEPIENGPLLVKGVSDLQGSGVGAKPVMRLCRCGQSANKPFCDGSHKAAGFESQTGTPAGKDRQLKYEGAQVDVYFNPRLCAHAAECNRLAAHVFDAQKRPWIQPDNGSRDEMEAVIAGCPSGALTLGEKGSAPEHRDSGGPRLTIEKNGPYWVRGVALKSPLQGEGMSPRKYVLCRCGQSGNKPFCDGSHRDNGWVAL